MQGVQLNVFQLGLIPRLALASLPLFASPWLDDILSRFTDWSQLFFSQTYGPLFGLLVLAPFITATGARMIRIIALCVVTYAVYYAATWCIIETQRPLVAWFETEFLRFSSAVPVAVVATLALAAATAWIAPLRTSRRYWIYAGLAGLATGLEFWIIDEINPSGRYMDWLFVLQPVWIWPVSTCVAIYFGRDRESTN
jgi:hypothetical protein